MEEVEDIGYVDDKFYKTNAINKIPFHENNIVPKKKKISYDDLLSSMGMKLINGKLELYNKNLIGRPPPLTQPTPKNYEDYRYHQNINYQNRNNQNINYQNINYQNRNNQNINYQNRNNQNINYQNQQKNYPMTEQQYRKHIQLQYLKNQYERQRVKQIKSKKILFTNPNTLVNIKNDNNLYQLRFKIGRSVGALF
jgi:hypothetical protein